MNSSPLSPPGVGPSSGAARGGGGEPLALLAGFLPPSEVARARALLLGVASPSIESFVNIEAREETEWLYAKLLDAALVALPMATSEAAGVELVAADPMILDRFGPAFTSPRFRWHADAMRGDGRLVSVVLYLSATSEYVGGDFCAQVECEGEGDGAGDGDGEGAPAPAPALPRALAERSVGFVRDATRSFHKFRFEAGDVVAFESCALEHCVTDVKAGTRISTLLIAGDGAFDRTMHGVPYAPSRAERGGAE